MIGRSGCSVNQPFFPPLCMLRVLCELCELGGESFCLQGLEFLQATSKLVRIGSNACLE